MDNKTPPLDKLPGGWAPTIELSLTGNPNGYRENIAEGIFCLHDILSENDVAKLLQLMEMAPQKTEVSVQGLKKEAADEKPGSERVTMWFPDLAEQLYKLMTPWLEKRIMTDFSRTDWWQQGKYKTWEPVALSPLLRFMAYKPGAAHFPHYDAAYIYPDSRYRSLMSVLFYLTSHADNGATRFLDDGQDNLPEWERQHPDWLKPAKEEDVLIKIQPKAASILVFDHRLLHDAELYTGTNPRILVRGDLVFRAI